MATTTEEDELELEDQKKKPQQPIGKPIVGPQQGPAQKSIGQPIGTPIAPPAPANGPDVLPGASAPTAPASMAPPEMPAPQSMPTAPQSASPIGQPIAPRTPRPEYHGLNRVLDTIAGATKIGSAIEGAGGLGTIGWRAKNADEERQIQQGEQERAANAGLEKTQAETGAETALAGQREATSHNVQVTINGTTYSVPAKDAEKLIGTGITTNAANERNTATNDSREDIASGKNTSAESIARGRETSQEKIARERTESAERIAQGRNLVSTEVAKIRAQAGNDPNKLTMMMRTQKQQAQATLPAIDKALDETEKVAQLLGPGAGRWNQFMQGKIGISDPAFAHYADEIGMVSTAVTLAHARGRMSNELFEHFQQMFDAGKQAPENMIQALDVAKEWLGVYANMGEPGSPGGGSNPVIHYKIQGGQLVPVPQTTNAGH